MFKQIFFLAYLLTSLLQVSAFAQNATPTLQEFIDNPPQIVILLSKVKKLPMPMSKIDQLIEAGDIDEDDVYADFKRYGKFKDIIKDFDGFIDCTKIQDDCLNLTDEEKVALHTYTMDFFNHINIILRGYSEQNKQLILPFLNTMTSALKKLPVERGYVTRVALNFPGIELYKPGSVITERAYTSTSIINEARANIKNYPENSIFFMIKSKTGRRVRQFSAAPGEDEVLFERGTRFKVKSHQRIGTKRMIEVEEL